MHNGWIGVDLDGTLAHYAGWKGPEHIGEPIMPMVERVKGWLAEGKTVKIFTARVYCPPEPTQPWLYKKLAEGAVSAPAELERIESEHKEWLKRWNETMNARSFIQVWCDKHFGAVLDITCTKDFGMIELWDDRCVQVVLNTGITISDYLKAVQNA
ncbi:MAG TPA: hypothetical protein VGQ12_07640 [Candidatus Angelobacter sp.]|jgi:hypothetical protein|nr:hypothetical protein [Candidatus Angelobacter sp.]